MIIHIQRQRLVRNISLVNYSNVIPIAIIIIISTTLIHIQNSEASISLQRTIFDNNSTAATKQNWQQQSQVLSGNHAIYVEPPADFKPIIYGSEKEQPSTAVSRPHQRGEQFLSSPNDISDFSSINYSPTLLTQYISSSANSNARQGQQQQQSGSAAANQKRSHQQSREQQNVQAMSADENESQAASSPDASNADISSTLEEQMDDKQQQQQLMKPSISRWSDWTDMSIEPDLASSDSSISTNIFPQSSSSSPSQEATDLSRNKIPQLRKRQSTSPNAEQAQQKFSFAYPAQQQQQQQQFSSFPIIFIPRNYHDWPPQSEHPHQRVLMEQFAPIAMMNEPVPDLRQLQRVDSQSLDVNPFALAGRTMIHEPPLLRSNMPPVQQQYQQTNFPEPKQKYFLLASPAGHTINLHHNANSDSINFRRQSNSFASKENLATNQYGRSQLLQAHISRPTVAINAPSSPPRRSRKLKPTDTVPAAKLEARKKVFAQRTKPGAQKISHQALLASNDKIKRDNTEYENQQRQKQAHVFTVGQSNAVQRRALNPLSSSPQPPKPQQVLTNASQLNSTAPVAPAKIPIDPNLGHKRILRRKRIKTQLPVGLSSWFLGGIRDLDGKHWQLPDEIISKLAINDVDLQHDTQPAVNSSVQQANTNATSQIETQGPPVAQQQPQQQQQQTFSVRPENANNNRLIPR